MTAGPSSPERAPRLVLRFALYSALALLLAGLGILWFVRHEARASAERAVLEQARVTVAGLAHHLGADDFRRPAGPAERSALDQLFADELTGGIVEVRLWSRAGVLTYATDHSVIGARDTDLATLGRALAGDAVLTTRQLRDARTGEEVKVLAARVPVTLNGAEGPAGVLEVYEDYGPVAAEVRELVTPVAAVLALALVLLYAALFPILRQVTRALEHRNRRLAEQAAELASTLAERRSAVASLRQAQTRYRALVEQLPLVTYVDALDETSSSLYMSPQIEPLLGYSPEEWLADREMFPKLLHPADRERVLAEHRQTVAEGRSLTTEYRLVGKDGRVVWFHDEVMVVRDDEGRPLHAQGFLVDVTERKAAEEAVRASEERFRSLVANVPGVIFRCAVDEHWTAEFLSDAVEELTGYPASDFVGNHVRTFGSILHPDDAERFGAEIHAAIEAWRPYVAEYRVVRSDGEVRWAREYGQAARGGPDGLWLDGVIFDVTEARAAQAERERLLAETQEARAALAAQNERLLELDRLKDEFIALVSHELRTPLTSIRGYLELLLEGEAGELSDEQRQFLGIVERNSHRLLHLVGDLLFLAQIEAGKLALEVEAVDLAALASESVEAVRPLAEEKGVALTLATGPVPLLAGDGGRLAQLLDNLVSNALKFTPAGGRIDVRVHARAGEAVLEVRDTGMGIPADERQHLFERFFRSSRATDGAIPGTGLGLAISKAITEAHRGSITVSSNEDAGTTFSVSIPIEARAGVPAAERVAL